MSRFALPAFGTYVSDLLEQAAMSQRAFAKELNLNQGFLGKVLKGLRRPPLKNLEDMAQILGLDAEATELLLELAHLEHTTPWLRQRYLTYKKPPTLL